MTRSQRNGKGLFVVFDGPDGGGKTTQIEMLKKYLTEQNYKVHTTREPGGTYIGEHLRALLKEVHGDIAPRVTAELLMFGAARAQHLDEVIIPALNDNCIVLCDRFMDATTAYQGYGRGVDLRLIKQIHELSVGRNVPDLTMFLDMPVEINEQRILARAAKDTASISKPPHCRFDSERMEFKQRVRAGYLQIAKNNARAKNKRNIVLIDADNTKKAIFATVVRVVTRALAAIKI